jgi:hypothetical protein
VFPFFSLPVQLQLSYYSPGSVLLKPPNPFGDLKFTNKQSNIAN